MDFDLHDLNKEVDLMCYLGNDIIGLCARFIMYDKRCEPPSSDKITQIRDSDEKYKLIDTFALKEVTQVIYIYIKRDKCDKWVYSPNDGFNINDPIKRLWKRAVNYVIGSMVEKPNNRTRYTPVYKIGTMLKIEMVTEIPMLILANITENDKHVLNLEIYGPGDCFNFVVTKAKMDFDLHGNKINLKIGDRMEFIDVRAPSSDKITQIRDSDEKYKKLILMLKTRTRSVSSHILKEINVINGFTPQMMDRKIFHDDYISYEDFNINDPIKRLWKRAGDPIYRTGPVAKYTGPS
ncbi:9564_t:CDS:2 [Entrophospora sp. SA101]|nr:9564_t:CDS:2 [Entrophospora sp. SA101]